MMDLTENYSVKTTSIVVLSILNHYLRRKDGDDFVVGTLVGSRSNDDNTVYVNHCFAVSLQKIDEQITLDMEYHKQMCELHAKTAPMENIIGWFTTATTLDSLTPSLNEHYANSCPNQSPILLCVDPSFQSGNDFVKAFLCRQIGGFCDQVPRIGVSFQPIPCEINSRGNPGSKHGQLFKRGLSSKTGEVSILDELHDLEQSVAETQELITRMLSYVREVTSGKTKGDPQIGRFLKEMLSCLSNVDSKQFEVHFKSQVQELMMIVHLSNLIKKQVGISQKLYRQVNK